jgi:hypothetical protein
MVRNDARVHMPFATGMRRDRQCLPTDDVDCLTDPAGVRQSVSKGTSTRYGDHVHCWARSGLEVRQTRRELARRSPNDE